jgi:riboflavin kinase/FMN adenylyltransferase
MVRKEQTMRIHTSNESFSPDQRSVVTVGNFDGVHTGHRTLLQEVVARARSRGLVSAVVTFEPHTRQVAQGQSIYHLLSTLEEKSILIERSGIDTLVVVPFNEALSRQMPEMFVEEVLVNRLHIDEWVMGKGHAIGRNRAGDENFLRLMQGKYHFTTIVADLLAREGTVVSSTQIRDCIMQGRIAEAAVMLGHPYLISVERTRGRKLGTTFGYPTLNFKSPPSLKVIPPPGVYAAEMEYKGTYETGALYFGECPTLRERREVHFEFFSFDRGGFEIPEGDKANLWLHSFIRADLQFGSIDELVAGIGSDVKTVKTFFTKEKEQCR